jgi:L-ascorbate metabolism protein UlaG (beta-lactamase superfamily)
MSLSSSRSGRADGNRIGATLLLAALLGAMPATAGGPTPSAGPLHPANLTATFIGNMAFHITDGTVAVLTDFPYVSGAFGYMTWTTRQVPAGPRPLCLITHGHQDHFAPDLAPRYCGALLGPKDVRRNAGIEAMAMADVVRWQGLTIRPIATPHADIEHESYLVEWQGQRLYFSGDTEDTTALLAARDLDVAFVSPWLAQAVDEAGAAIDARRIVIYHHRPGEALRRPGSRIVPKQGDVLALPARTSTTTGTSGGPGVEGRGESAVPGDPERAALEADLARLAGGFDGRVGVCAGHGGAEVVARDVTRWSGAWSGRGCFGEGAWEMVGQ